MGSVRSITISNRFPKVRLPFVQVFRALFSVFVLQACLSWLEEGGSLLEEMEREARSAPLQYRAEMLASTRSYKSRYNTANQCFGS